MGDKDDCASMFPLQIKQQILHVASDQWIQG